MCPLPAKAQNSLPGVTVVLPVRNGEAFIEACLRGIEQQRPAEVIVVDGDSGDRTLEIVRQHQARILSDGGRGVAAARTIGVEAATTPWVALVDVDVLLPVGSLAALLEEARREGYGALQAGLHSVSGPGYWGQALAYHHNKGISRGWFGLVATLFDRELFLKHRLDDSFKTGEDIEMRWRLERAGVRIGVSDDIIVGHQFGDTFGFAKDQFLADGAGLARTSLKHGWLASPLLALPFAAAARGMLLSLRDGQPRWLPYYAAFLAYNWIGMVNHLVARLRERR